MTPDRTSEEIRRDLRNRVKEIREDTDAILEFPSMGGLPSPSNWTSSQKLVAMAGSAAVFGLLLWNRRRLYRTGKMLYKLAAPVVVPLATRRATAWLADVMDADE